MNTIQLKMQLGAFADLSAIHADSETLGVLFDLYREDGLFPSVAKEFLGPAQAAASRPKLADENERWAIVALSGRVDVSYTFELTPDNDPISWEDFRARALPLLTKFLEHFEITANRLSLIKELLYYDFDIDNYRTRFINPTPTYENSEISEWNSRLSARQNCPELGETEQLNIITDVTHVEMAINLAGQAPRAPKDIEGVIMQFDINTYQHNKKYRFSAPEIETFFGICSEIAGTLEQEAAPQVEDV